MRRRATAISRVHAKSAVVSSSTPGVLLTATPRRVHASTSILSNPTAILATVRKCGAALKSSSSIFSVRRQIKPSLSATRRKTSARGGRSESLQYSASQSSSSFARGPSNKRCVTNILGRSIQLSLRLPDERREINTSAPPHRNARQAGRDSFGTGGFPTCLLVLVCLGKL